jgi:hypothetical protein
MGIATTELTPVEQTAFLTECARALDSRWPKPILGDTLADEVVGKIDYDFTGLGVQTSVVPNSVAREEPRMTLVEEASLAFEPEVDRFPGWVRVATKVARKSKAGARKARILRYRF